MTAARPLWMEASDQAIEDQARAWVLRLAEIPEAAPECDAWRSQNPAHEAAFQEAQKIWNAAQALASVLDGNWREEVDALTRSPVMRAQHWALLGAGRVVLPLALAASLVLGIALPQFLQMLPAPIEPPGPVARVVETRIAETRVLTLNDGSRVTLGARTGVEVQFEAGRRQVRLEDGQAFFEVAHDAARPFVVLAGNAEIRVTGTKFDVRRIGDDIEVSVLEGRVELNRRTPAGSLPDTAPVRVLTAGQSSHLERGLAFTPATPAAITPGDWRTGRLYYSEAPLSEIIADVQRYSPVPIRIASSDVAAMRVTTSFRADNLDQLVTNLESTLPITSRRTSDGGIVLAAR